MAFDPNAVNWTPEELNAAERLDKIYEGLRDGLDYEDFMLVLEIEPLWNFLKSDDRGEFADKLIALATIMYRDNFDPGDAGLPE